MSGEGNYVCTLDKDSLKKAKDELNEDPKQRASQIDALRQWVKSQPHLNSRTDDDFLLRFLRQAKFSQLKAQERLDNFWTVRTNPEHGVKDWFSTMDPLDPKNKEVLELGMQFPLPGRDDQNRKVILIRTGGYNPEIHSFDHVLKTGFITTDILLKEELNQIHGIVGILDFSDFGTAHAWAWSRETIQKSMKCWQDVYPTRNKGMNYYNTPTLFNALFEIFKYFMKEKMKKRIKFHKDSLESLHKEVPKRMLPEEYGGTAGPMKDLVKQWNDHLIANRDEIMLNTRYGVDESKRPKTETKAKDNDSSWNVVGSFRKLAVD